MIRELASKTKIQRSSFIEVKKLITSSLGIKPKNGGKPPSEKRAIKESVFVFVSGMDLSCLKWKIWLALSKNTTEEETIEYTIRYVKSMFDLTSVEARSHAM